MLGKLKYVPTVPPPKPHPPWLTNLYLPGEAFVWYRLLPGWFWDLEPEEFANDHVGERPEWLDEDLNLDMVLAGGNRVRWALREGLAPGQPFCVWFSEPEYVQDYWGECDTDFDWDVLPVTPTANAGKSWERFKDMAERGKQKHDRHMQHKLNLAWARHDHLYLQWSTYGGDRYGCWGKGSRLHLKSDLSCPRHAIGWHRYLAAGEDDNGNSDKAFAQLAEKTMARNPDLDLAFLKTLKTRLY